jgi:hypothetical protein
LEIWGCLEGGFLGKVFAARNVEGEEVRRHVEMRFDGVWMGC